MSKNNLFVLSAGPDGIRFEEYDPDILLDELNAGEIDAKEFFSAEDVADLIPQYPACWGRRRVLIRGKVIKPVVVPQVTTYKLPD